jgi:membrane fusion protein (multidrug efflux system)
MLSLNRLIVSMIVVLSLAACGKPPGGMSGFPPPEVTTVTVTAGDVPVESEYVGQVAGSREVEIRARVTGIVEKRLYEEGSRVNAGQPLFRIDPAPFAAQAASAEADAAAARSRLKQAEREYARLKSLVEMKAGSQKELDDAASLRDLSAAGLQAAEARLAGARTDLAYTDIRAPIAGMIGRALKVEGSMVTANNDNLLAVMSQTDPIYVNFGVSEADRIRFRQEIASGSLKLRKQGFVVRAKTADGNLLSQTGRLDFNDYKADADTGSFSARAVFANADNALSPGQFVRVVLSGAYRPRTVTVPQRAVMEGPAGKFVYVVGKGKQGEPIAELRPVMVGEWTQRAGEGNLWVVKQGIKPGDQLIVDGVAKIFMPGTPVKPTAGPAKS